LDEEDFWYTSYRTGSIHFAKEVEARSKIGIIAKHVETPRKNKK
jgi:hypothetical protein